MSIGRLDRIARRIITQEGMITIGGGRVAVESGLLRRNIQRLLSKGKDKGGRNQESPRRLAIEKLRRDKTAEEQSILSESFGNGGLYQATPLHGTGGKVARLLGNLNDRIPRSPDDEMRDRLNYTASRLKCLVSFMNKTDGYPTLQMKLDFEALLQSEINELLESDQDMDRQAISRMARQKKKLFNNREIFNEVYFALKQLKNNSGGSIESKRELYRKLKKMISIISRQWGIKWE